MSHYNIARVHPDQIPIGVIMVHFSTYARPCVHPMTCASQMSEGCARCVIKSFLQRDDTIKNVYLWELEAQWNVKIKPTWETIFAFFFCTENFVINREHNLFSRDHLLYFHYVIKELVHAFSCAYIELWMHLGSLESTQEARVALGYASSNSYASLVLSKLPACIHNSIYAR